MACSPSRWSSSRRRRSSPARASPSRAFDGDLADAVAQALGVALDGVDALQRGGQLGAGGLELAVVLALDALERGAQLTAGGLGLGDALQRGLHLGVARLALAGALGADRGLELGEPGLEVGAGLGGLGERRGQARLGAGGGLGARGLQALQAGEQLGAVGVVVAALGLGGLAVQRGALQALEAGEQLDPLPLGLRAGGAGRAGRDVQALDLHAGLLGLALGGLGAAAGGLRLALGLGDLAGQLARDALELVDALQRGEQAADDRGGVVEVVDRVALDAGIGVGQRLLALRVLAGALLGTADELLLDPRRRRQRAEGDHRAGGAPALPVLRLRVERRAQGADHDRVLLAHAQQHQVHRELEGEVLEEEREVEALVELDRDEDGLERERLAAGFVLGVDLDECAGVRRVAGREEAAPLLGVLAQRAGEQVVEERVAEGVGRLLAEQHLGRLGPLGHGALAVGEQEPAADDLLEQRVERIRAHVLRALGLGGGRRHGGLGIERAGGGVGVEVSMPERAEGNGCPLDRPIGPEP